MDQQTIERTCPVCDTVYTARVGRLKFGRETTCSRACSYELRSKQRDRKVSLACAVCGTKFSRSVSCIKGKHGGQFCSRACHYAARSIGLSKRVVTKPYVISDAARVAWRIGAEKTRHIRIERDNYRHTDETRAKLSEATARSLAEGRHYIVSKLEDKVAAELDRRDVDYIRQFRFRDRLGRFVCVTDFYFPALNAVLEVNGTYWHVDPRVYPAPINSTQEHCLSQYARKLKCLEERGVEMAEVWELDLKRNVSEAVTEAYARLTGG